jgi:hypothetical protein
MVLNTMTIEDPAHVSAFGEQPGHCWSQGQVNQGFHVEELTPHLEVEFEVSISVFSYWISVKTGRGREMLRSLHFL